MQPETRTRPSAGILDISGARQQIALMKHFTIPTCLFLVLAASAILAADLPAPIAPTERMDLFNGKDFSGWTICLRSNAPPADTFSVSNRSEEHTSELQSLRHLVCRLL